MVASAQILTRQGQPLKSTSNNVSEMTRVLPDRTARGNSKKIATFKEQVQQSEIRREKLAQARTAHVPLHIREHEHPQFAKSKPAKSTSNPSSTVTSKKRKRALPESDDEDGDEEPHEPREDFGAQGEDLCPPGNDDSNVVNDDSDHGEEIGGDDGGDSDDDGEGDNDDDGMFTIQSKNNLIVAQKTRAHRQPFTPIQNDPRIDHTNIKRVVTATRPRSNRPSTAVMELQVRQHSTPGQPRANRSSVLSPDGILPYSSDFPSDFELSATGKTSQISLSGNTTEEGGPTKVQKRTLKDSVRSRGKPKISDFIEDMTPTIHLACSYYRVFIATRDSFPVRIEQDKFAREAWQLATQEYNTTFNATQDLYSVLRQRASQLRGELKRIVRGLVESHYGFEASNQKTIREELANKAAFLLKNNALDPYKRTGLFETPILLKAIANMWFNSIDDEGVTFHVYFNPIPISTIALVFTAIENCVHEWGDGTFHSSQFTEEKHKSIYLEHLTTLETWQAHERGKRILARLQQNLHDQARARSKAGDIDIARGPRLTEDDIDAAIREADSVGIEPEADGS